MCCKLCSKYADDCHVLSSNHVWRGQNPDLYVQDTKPVSFTDSAMDA